MFLSPPFRPSGGRMVLGPPFECTISIRRSDSRSIDIANIILLGTRVGKFAFRLASIIHIIIGFFNPGPQPLGAPIIADVTDDPALQVNVSWKNARNQIECTIADVSRI